MKFLTFLLSALVSFTSQLSFAQEVVANKLDQKKLDTIRVFTEGKMDIVKLNLPKAVVNTLTTAQKENYILNFDLSANKNEIEKSHYIISYNEYYTDVYVTI